MKIYGCPRAIPAPKTDLVNFDPASETRKQEEHAAALKTWLVENGCQGKHTGEIIRFPVGDGAALYMLGDGPKSCLIHLPYGDGYSYPDAQFLPKREIVRRIEAQKSIDALFAKCDENATPSAPGPGI